MKHLLLSVMCMVSILASAQGIIIHEKNDNKTSYKTTDVERIEFSQSVTESSSSTYATKQELQDGLDAKADKTALNGKADKSEITALQNLNTALQNRVTALENALAELKKKIEELPVTPEPSATFEDITVNGTTYKLGTSGAVDLGLSVKWATMNVGASSPGDYGDYYAWGETATKSTYNWSTYFDSVSGSSSNFTKYATDKKTVLVPEDDVAHVKWGGSWRMPTKAELDELREKCAWVWTQYGGHNGYVVIGSTGNAIFLPAADYRSGGGLSYVGSKGYYWSSSLDSGYSYYAYVLYFHSGNVDWNYGNRYCGLSVRAVCP